MDNFLGFLFGMAALIGTLTFIVDPTRKFRKYVNGKKMSELKTETKLWIDKHDLSEIVVEGCGIIFVTVLDMFYDLVIGPLAVMFAISNRIGSQPIAYVVMGFVIWGWWRFLRIIAKGIAEVSQLQKRTVTQDDDLSNNPVNQDDKEIKLPHPVWIFARRLFLSLPTLYLWYLFLVMT